MSFHGRSLDDLPLAAYTKGTAPDVDEPEPLPDPGYTSVPASSSSMADRVAQAHAGADAAEAAAEPRRRFSLPFRLPRLGRGKQAELEANAPFHSVSAGGVTAAEPFEPVSHRPFEPVTVHVPVTDSSPGPAVRLTLPKQLRDPRVLAGGTVAVGLVLLVASVLGGGGPNLGIGPNSSQSTTGGLQSAAPGNATVELTGGGTGLFTLNGSTGSGPAVNSRVDATWSDVLGHHLELTGPASAGTRTTDPNFVLSWTMVIDGVPVTFMSRAAECTVGMAVSPRAVRGTFHCKKLTSDGGAHVIDIRGDFTT